MKQEQDHLSAPGGQQVQAHTPGPWKCVECEFGDYQTGQVAFVVSTESGPMFASVRNCNLIAAAPDLLEAARKTLSVRRADDGSYDLDALDEAIDAARAALARALESQ